MGNTCCRKPDEDVLNTIESQDKDEVIKMSTKFRKFNFKKLNFPRKKDDAQQTNTAKKQISPERQKRIDFLNKYSLLFHLLLSCGLVFVIEWIYRKHTTLSKNLITKG